MEKIVVIAGQRTPFGAFGGWAGAINAKIDQKKKESEITQAKTAKATTDTKKK